MDDSRGDQPAPESGPQLPGRIRVGLSPVQAAHGHYSDHAGSCPKCRDIDRGRCSEGEQLWQAWNAALDDAYRRLHPGRP